MTRKPAPSIAAVLAVASSLALSTPAWATPATADQEAAMATEAAKTRIDDVRERTLRAKARLFLLQAALESTRTYAKTAEQAIANADQAAKAEDEARRTVAHESDTPRPALVAASPSSGAPRR
ncbi:MAG: hypothetical protein QM765_45035 [Myxococcales bacterium]